jgi:hypothetical protein
MKDRSERVNMATSLANGNAEKGNAALYRPTAGGGGAKLLYVRRFTYDLRTTISGMTESLGWAVQVHSSKI